MMRVPSAVRMWLATGYADMVSPTTSSQTGGSLQPASGSAPGNSSRTAG
jgi:hypothetical protein